MTQSALVARTTRIHSLMMLALVAIAGCSATSGTEPPRALPATVGAQTVIPPQPPSASIAGAGDSIVAVMTVRATCGRTVGASADVSQHDLTMAVILTSTSGVQTCDPINGSTIYRVATHGVPPGAYNVRAYFRLAPSGADTVMATRALMLP